ncbi:9280_t:CDS:2, partial [Funneliformis mosseae]
VNQDPDFKPRITDMFRILRDCHKEFIKAPPSSINSQKQGYMQTKLKNPAIPTPKRKFRYADSGNIKDKEKVIAELFKEVADDEANEFPEAKLRYGDCLYNGKGVKQNLVEALKYFEKAAENGLKVAMYNAGNLHFKGCGGDKRDLQKAEYYMKLAAYIEYPPAIKFCKEHDFY